MKITMRRASMFFHSKIIDAPMQSGGVFLINPFYPIVFPNGSPPGGCFFRATPHNGARRFGQCFDPSESMENAGILDVFPIFHTARLGQKIRRSPQLPPKRCCLKSAVLLSAAWPRNTRSAYVSPTLAVRAFHAGHNGIRRCIGK